MMSAYITSIVTVRFRPRFAHVQENQNQIHRDECYNYRQKVFRTNYEERFGKSDSM